MSIISIIIFVDHGCALYTLRRKFSAAFIGTTK